MLLRLETAYLGILRVVILVIATVALIVAALALASAFPTLIRQLGMSAKNEAVGGKLGEFIAEKKLTVQMEPSTETAPQTTTRYLNVNLISAAKTLYTYLKADIGVTEQELRSGIEKSSETALPVLAIPAYYKDLKVLTDQLAASKGKRLTTPQVGELVAWHQARFLSDFNAKSASDAQDAAAFYVKIYAAGAAFMFFILVVFTFLFVKIERSLRLVRTVRSDSFDA